jgi:hypothetical protein
MRPHFGVLMKFLYGFFLFLMMTFLAVFTVHAQAAETIWIQADTTSYKTGEAITVTLNAISATPIQGFTAQIKYDPDCLVPDNATSPISGMNGLAVPQGSGLVDASFASTTPQVANGVVANIRFLALKGCQTNLSLVTAALVIKNEAGFAAPLTSIAINNQVVSLNIDSAVGVPQPTTVLDGSVLPLAPTILPEQKPANGWVIALIILLVVIVLITIFVVYKLSRK